MISQLPTRRSPASAPRPPALPDDRDDLAYGSTLASLAAPAADTTLDVHRYLQVLRHRWRLVAAIVAVTFAGTAIGTLLKTPVYRATGVIELRGQSADVGTVEALFRSDRPPAQYLETQYGVLRSAALARMVIADLGRPLAEDLGAAPGTAPASPDAVPERLANAFTQRRFVDPVAGSNLVKLHFESADPALAARVVAAVFENYARLQSDVSLASVARLAAQVDSTRERLTADEQRLQHFAQQNGLDLVESDRGTTESLPHERLRTLQRQLTEAEVERYARESRVGLQQAQGDDALDSEALRTLNVRLAGLRGEYAKLRSTFSDAYPRTREVKEQLVEQETLLVRERQRIRAQQASELRAAVRRQALLQAAVDSQRALVDRQGEQSARYRILARDAEAQRQLYAMLREKLQGARVSAAMASTHLSVIEPASVPTAPARPILATNLLLGAVIGLALGLGTAFVREYADGTLRTVEDVDTLAVPLLGIIPSVTGARAHEGADSAVRAPGRRSILPRATLAPGWRTLRPAGAVDGRVPAVDRAQPGAPSAGWLDDAFASLRTSVLLDDAHATGRRSLLVTSAQPSDGKTMTCVNLARSLAKLGRRVLLVDADTRRSAVHEMLAIPPGPGLTDWLRDGTGWMSLVRADVAPGLDVLPAGSAVSSPVELLASPRMGALIDEASARYDFVLVDSPALLINAADARVLAAIVDGVIVVIRSGSTPRATLDRLLRRVPNLAGVVLNGLDARLFSASYYSYGPVAERTMERSGTEVAP